MIRVNLFPTARKVRRDIRGIIQLIGGVAVVVLVLAFVVVLDRYQAGKIEGVKSEIARVKKEVDQLEEIKKKVDDFKAKSQELRRKIEVINTLEKNRTGPLFVMEALSRDIPERAWIDSFSEKGAAAKISGVAWNEFVVADFMKGLQPSPYFKNIELKVIKTEQIANLPLKRFSIESRLDYAGTVVKKKEDEEKAAVEEKKEEKKEVKKETQVDDKAKR